MKKYVLFAMVPSMLPSILIFSSYGIVGLSEIMNPILVIVISLLFGIFLALINPMTYFFAFMFGYSAFKIKNIWQRLLVQVLALPILSTLIYLLTVSLNTKSTINFIETIKVYAGMAVIHLIFSLISLGIEKLYFKLKATKKERNFKSLGFFSKKTGLNSNKKKLK